MADIINQLLHFFPMEPGLSSSREPELTDQRSKPCPYQTMHPTQKAERPLHCHGEGGATPQSHMSKWQSPSPVPGVASTGGLSHLESSHIREHILFFMAQWEGTELQLHSSGQWEC